MQDILKFLLDNGFGLIDVILLIAIIALWKRVLELETKLEECLKK